MKAQMKKHCHRIALSEQQAFSCRDIAPGKNESILDLTLASESVPAGRYWHDISGDTNSFEYAGDDHERDVDAPAQTLVCDREGDHHQRPASVLGRAYEENRLTSIATPHEYEQRRPVSDQSAMDSKEVTLRAFRHPPVTAQPDGQEILDQDIPLTLSDIPAPAIVRQVGALRWWRSLKPRRIDFLFGQSVREAHRMVRRALMAHMDEEHHSETHQQRGNILGVLLHGPSGNGKTLFAEMLAHPWRDTEQHRDWPALNLIPIQAADIVSARVGEAERAMRSVLTVCESMGNCVLFIDHIEMLTPARDALLEAGGVHERVLSLLLQYLDGFYARQGRHFGFVVATDVPHVLDRALLRPGRLDIQVALSAPDAEARQEAIEYHLCRSIKSITLPSRLRAASTALVASTSGQSMAAVRQAASDLAWNLVGGLDALLQSK
ncbi:hypothetical protein F1559_002168 [Cyanidiococcus yangmingshanensis]|uniref:AAA+ ATPase domain-containing protein n=1 Tax=Cyanidiococcus yangmingshanensis TaxID=2690220 RepID=A0A7J7IDF0_9RHOD|nr:hypothetical protein F1559_002168 [Cyanidiococcus yangmingshanensis]